MERYRFDNHTQEELENAAVPEAKMAEIKKENEQAKAACQENLNTSEIYKSIVNALSQDFFDLYYVDTETDEYIEYGFWTETGRRTEERRGTDFFAESRKNAGRFVFEEDRERFAEEFDKERLLSDIKKHGAFIFYYRLLINGVPAYVRMKATHIAGDDRHIFIGVSNVDTQVRDRLAAEHAEEERKLYLCLNALSGNLIVLYIVDPDNGQYTEFSSSKGYDDLGIAKQGTSFFRAAYNDSLRTVHPEDRTLFHAQVTKENVLAAIERDGVFALDYRLMTKGLPTYVRLKAVRVEEEGKTLLIFGLLDQDAQVRQEQEYARNLSVARKMATVDSLTGIKNKHAYAQLEAEINAEIKTGQKKPFALVVCDINNLKSVNDLYGHKAGDACIRKACAKI